jgi:hypothetical protein
VLQNIEFAEGIQDFRQYVMREDVMRAAEVWRCGGTCMNMPVLGL